MAEDAGGYIKHHLTNLTYGKHPKDGWGFAENAEQAAEMRFLGDPHRLHVLVARTWGRVLPHILGRR